MPRIVVSVGETRCYPIFLESGPKRTVNGTAKRLLSYDR